MLTKYEKELDDADMKWIANEWREAIILHAEWVATMQLITSPAQRDYMANLEKSKAKKEAKAKRPKKDKKMKSNKRKRD